MEASDNSIRVCARSIFSEPAQGRTKIASFEISDPEAAYASILKTAKPVATSDVVS